MLCKMELYTPTLSDEDIQQFHEKGFVTVRGVVRPDEIQAVQKLFADFMERRIPVEGKDWGEHTPGLFNVTAFTLYHPMESLGIFSVLEQRCSALAAQLYKDHDQTTAGRMGRPASGGPLVRDYEQLLRKTANKPKAVFPPHQDMHYWPKSKSGAFDTRTATCSIAVNDATTENGCLWAIPGTHKSQWLYPGCTSKLEGSRVEGGGVITLQVLPEDEARKEFLPLRAGDMTIHEEWIVHGSEGNAAAEATRDTLIFAFRPRDTVAMERSEGFRHSYNDPDQVLRRVREHIWD